MGLENNLTLVNKSYAIFPGKYMTSSKISYETVILASLCTIICIGGFVGNFTIASTILRRKKMRTATNWFVFNLTISDLAIVLLTIPYNLIDPYIDWPFGEIGCRYLVMPVMEHFAGVCVLTHTAVGLARYIIVSNSGKRDIISTKHVRTVICLIWLVAFLSLSVTLMGWLGEFQLEIRDGRMRCMLKWISPTRRMAYRSCAFILTYVVPMTVTGFSYYRLHKIVSQSLKILGEHLPKDIVLIREKHRREMNSILMKMYIMFAITTLPLQAFLFLFHFKVFKRFAAAKLLFNLLLTLFYAQVVTNPLVLFYMGEEYRKEIYQLPVCCCVTVPTTMQRFSLLIRRSLHGTVKPYRHRKTSWKKNILENKKVSTVTVTNLNSNMSIPLLGEKEYQSNERNSNGMTSNELDFEFDTNNHALCQQECLQIKDDNVTLESSISNVINENSMNDMGEVESDAVVISVDTGVRRCEEVDGIADEITPLKCITAYYDDGTIMYVYDPVIGCVSLAHDSGRETNI